MSANANAELTTKTQQDLDNLKANWLGDPCWDLETTEGFEAHQTELYVFRLEHENACMRRQLREIHEFRKQLKAFIGE